MKLVRRAALILVLAYWVFMLVMTHIPREPEPQGAFIADTTAHMIGYGTLAGLLYVCLWAWRPGFRWAPVLILLVAMTYGAIDEWTQPYFRRTCDMRDWVADLAGAGIAIAALGLVHWISASCGCCCRAESAADPATAGTQASDHPLR